MLAVGADPNEESADGAAALSVAMKAGAQEVVQLLLAAGAKGVDGAHDEKTTVRASSARKKESAARLPSQFWHACKAGDVSSVVAMLAEGADPNEADGRRVSALSNAAATGTQEIVQLLLSAGACVTLQSLVCAARRGDPAILSSLLTAGPKVTSPTGFVVTPLLVASASGHAVCVELLLAHEAAAGTINQRNGKNQSALFLACVGGHIPVAYLLLDAGADCTSACGLTSASSSAVYRRMINDGQQVTISSFAVWTPLHAAVLIGNAELVQRLISKGADVNAKSESGLTPLHIAAAKGHLTIVTALLDSGAASDIPFYEVNSRGSPLFLACEFGHTEVVKLLLQRGASPERVGVMELPSLTAKSRMFQSGLPLHVAALKGHAACIATLLQSRLPPPSVAADDAAMNYYRSIHKLYEYPEVLLQQRVATELGQSESPEVLGLGIREGWQTPLMLACSALGHTEADCSEVVRLLLQDETAMRMIDATDDGGMTALHYAAALSGQSGAAGSAATEAVRLLTAAGADTSILDKAEHIAAYYAGAAGGAEAFTLLMTPTPAYSRTSKGASKGKGKTGTNNNKASSSSIGSSGEAASSGTGDEEGGANVPRKRKRQAADRDCGRLLHFACKLGSVDVLARLLALPSLAPNSSSSEAPSAEASSANKGRACGWNRELTVDVPGLGLPLSLAAEGGHVTMVQLLLDAGAEINGGAIISDVPRPPPSALGGGVGSLLDKHEGRPSLHEDDPAGFDPAAAAASAAAQGRPAAAASASSSSSLFPPACPVDVVGQPLMRAVKAGNIAGTQCLLQAGARTGGLVTTAVLLKSSGPGSYKPLTILGVAAEAGKLTMLQALIGAFGPDALRSDAAADAVKTAAHTGRTGVLQYLITSGAPQWTSAEHALWSRGSDARPITILELAVDALQVDTVRYLLNCGIDLAPPWSMHASAAASLHHHHHRYDGDGIFGDDDVDGHGDDGGFEDVEVGGLPPRAERAVTSGSAAGSSSADPPTTPSSSSSTAASSSTASVAPASWPWLQDCLSAACTLPQEATISTAAARCEIIDILLGACAKVNGMDSSGCAAIHRAIRAASSLPLRYDRYYGSLPTSVKVNTAGGPSAHDTAAADFLLVVRHLLCNGAHPNLLDVSNSTAVKLAMRSSRSSSFEMLRVLAGAGGDLRPSLSQLPYLINAAQSGMDAASYIEGDEHKHEGRSMDKQTPGPGVSYDKLHFLLRHIHPASVQLDSKILQSAAAALLATTPADRERYFRPRFGISQPDIYAPGSNRLPLLRWLLRAGADPGGGVYTLDGRLWPRLEKETLLAFAVGNGVTAPELQLMAEYRPAAINAQVTVVQDHFIDDVKIETQSGTCALVMAGNLFSLPWICRQQSRSDKGTQPILAQASLIGELIACGADVNATDDQGCTALAEVCRTFTAGCQAGIAAIQLLLKAGASPNAGTLDSYTPLVLLCQNRVVTGATDAGRACEEEGADATDVRQAAIVLIQAGADVNACAHDGMTALQAARKGWHTKLAALLEAAGGTC